jgi:single-strand DNA-binding protein
MNDTSNRVVIIGHLGRDPEIKTFGDDKKLAKMSLAVNGGFKTVNGETTMQTEWHNVVAWGKLADWAEQNFMRGQKVCVEGKLSSRTYTGKDGIKRYTTEIVATALEMADQRN